MRTAFPMRAFVVCALASNIVGLAPAIAAPAKPALPKVPVYAISLSNSGHGHGRATDPGWAWVLNSNGTAQRNGDKGTFNPADFNHLVKYLQTSKLLDQKSPPETLEATDITGETTLSLVRGSKTKSLVVSDLAVEPENFWVMKNLIGGIFAGIDWKNDKGLSVNTGMQGFFSFGDNNSKEDWDAIMGAVFDVKNDKGKVVGTITLENQEGTYQLILPPGIYHVTLSVKGQSIPEGTAAPALPGNLIWHSFPASTFEVSEGQMMRVNISWEKKPTTP